MDEKSAREENSNTGRIGRIRKFVQWPPKRGHVLRLRLLDQTSLQLGEWLRDEVEGEQRETLPDTINTTLVDTRDELGCEVSALLAWYDIDGGLVSSKKLTARPMANSFAEQQLGMDGTASGQIVQMQHHTHVMMAECAKLLQALHGDYRDFNTELREENQDLRDRLREGYHERHELAGRLVDATLTGNEPAADDEQPSPANGNAPESEARAELIREVTSIVKSAAGHAVIKAAVGAMMGGAKPS